MPPTNKTARKVEPELQAGGALSTADTTGELVRVGHVAGAHGIRGEVVIKSYTEPPASIADYGPLSCRRDGDDGPGSTFHIETLRETGKGLISRIRGVMDRNAAEAMKGLQLFIPRDRLPDTEPDEWYHADLIGLAAVNVSGEPLGTVIAIPNYGAGDLIEVKPAKGGTSWLVPFTSDYVPQVSIATGRVVIDLPEGYLE